MQKKILSLALALVLLVSVFAPMTAMAASEGPTSTDPNAVTQTVTLHKLMMSKTDLADWTSPEQYDGTQDLAGLKALLAGKELKEIAGVFFAIKDKTDGKYVKADGSDPLKPADPYATTDNVEEAVGGLTTSSGITFKTETLKGQFEIVEITEKSTYVGDAGETITGSKAVPVEITLPLVNNDGTVLNAHVYPKNTEEKPKIDKDFKDQANPDNPSENKTTADHQIGDVIEYEIKTKIPANAKYQTAVWDDKMTEGLTLNIDPTSFNVTIGGASVASGDYNLAADEHGFILSLKEDGLAKINNKDSEVEVVITYSATLNKHAVVEVPESNDVMFHYGNNPGHGNTPIPTKPNEGNITVTKTFTGSEWPADGIKVQLYNANTGEKVGDVVTLTQSESSHTWNNLDNETEYKVVELTPGYQVIYGTGQTAGTLTIENKENPGNPTPLNPTEPKVVTYGKKFVKTDESNNRLAGAEFVIKNSDGKYLVAKSGVTVAAQADAVVQAKTELDNAVNAYNALTAEQQALPDQDPAKSALALINTKQAAYNQAVFTAGDKYEWGSKDDAIVLVSNDKGQFEIKGLKKGTYELEEIKAPAGYASIANISFTVNEISYSAAGNIPYVPSGNTNDALQVMNKKVTIPQTGGIGTVIFTVGGLALMGGAAVAMKRNRQEEAK